MCRFLSLLLALVLVATPLSTRALDVSTTNEYIATMTITCVVPPDYTIRIPATSSDLSSVSTKKYRVDRVDYSIVEGETTTFVFEVET